MIPTLAWLENALPQDALWAATASVLEQDLFLPLVNDVVLTLGRYAVGDSDDVVSAARKLMNAGLMQQREGEKLRRAEHILTTVRERIGV